VRGAAVDVVEVVSMVGTTIVGATYVPSNGCYRIGTAPGVDLPLTGAPHPSFPLVAAGRDGGWVLHWHPDIEGRLILDGALVDPSTLAGAREITIVPEVEIRVQIGRIWIRITRMKLARRHVPRARIDHRPLLFSVGSVVAHLLVVGLAHASAPEPRPIPHEPRPRLVRVQDLAPAPKRRVEPPLVDALDAQRVRHRVVTAPKPKRGGAANQPRERATARSSGILDSAELTAGLQRITGTVDLHAALSELYPLYNEEEAQAGNFGNSGGRFECADCETVPTGRYQTVAEGPGAGDGYDPSRDKSAGHAGDPPTAIPRVSMPKVSLCGGSTPCAARGAGTVSDVGHYFERRRGRIAACLEPALRVDPDMRGEVILEFEIDVDGKVKRVRRQGPAMFADCISHFVEASAFHPTLWGTQVTYSLMVQPTS
jgi:hypothetical protein